MKKSIEIDQQILKDTINELETAETFTTQSALFKAVAAKYIEKTQNNKVTPAVVMLRIKQFNIPIKTQKAVFDPSKFRERLNNSIKTDDCITPKAKQTVNQLLQYFEPEEKKKYLKLAKAVLRGSRKAAIKLNCISCGGGSTKEVKECKVDTCSLWLFRPYQ